MFKRIITATFFIIGLSVMTPAVAQNAVIIVFDVDRAISLSKAGKSMAEQLESQIQKVRTDETEVLKSLQSEAEKLKEQQKLLAPEALQKKVEELRLKEVERRRSLNEKSQSIQAGGQKAAAEIVKIAEEELTAISKERKADIVMRRDALFFASPALDVTAELVARLDKRLSK
ncbi:MAG: OmpH family outer membrane protein, partial [PS1 clade bacterium]|nr:OmpH family outer membrane protein [PS1 clade bacterium]